MPEDVGHDCALLVLIPYFYDMIVIENHPSMEFSGHLGGISYEHKDYACTLFL